MALHIEQIAKHLLSYLQARYGDALALVAAEQGSELSVTAPLASSYFIGEPSRYRPLDTPALFVTAQRTRRKDVESGGAGGVLYEEHDFGVNIVVEATTEDDLTLIAWRHAQAVDSILNFVDITPATVSAYSSLVHVTGIDYGPIYTKGQPDQRTFRKDVWLNIFVKHWDQYVPAP